jgi:SAM-dependent methyltransferase
VSEDWVGKVYSAESREALDGVYHQWADEYDATMAATGYLHFPVIIGLLTRYVPRLDATLLDAGVGTGALGNILSVLGYNNLQGLDMSAAMLAKANARKCYSGLTQGVLGEPLPFIDASFDVIVSTGTFTTGHAPASAFRELVRILEHGGHLIFTVGTAVWEDAGFKTEIENLVRTRALNLVEVTPIYRPMPYSATESDFTTRAHVYRKT